MPDVIIWATLIWAIGYIRARERAVRLGGFWRAALLSELCVWH
jgi:hypothetical protein